ncbi:uncharacterized protein LOC128422483 [Podarcis raffonei]|uniref:uncharacterized protein LOC128422483 n=1 Tax=Podarcis raffonei TaxID=65483 RepID=UPI0023294874|nr:uncharacterized protein LOC128422483 [Podarcis raffonei]
MAAAPKRVVEGCHGDRAAPGSPVSRASPTAMEQGRLSRQSRRQSGSPAPPSAGTKPAAFAKSAGAEDPAEADLEAAVSKLVCRVGRVQTEARTYLHSAIGCERAKRWREAIEYYRKLLSSLNKMKFPAEYVPGHSCIRLVFETYYHLGVALQKLDLHRDAVEAFTNAIEAANVPKSVCHVGCVSGSYYQTPAFARRAYAYVKCGKIKKAICDATRAVDLDPMNPDVYCIRALAWSSAKEKMRALTDLNFSFKLNSSHICTMILRGAILNSLGKLPPPKKNKDHEKASDISWESRNFFDVEDFYSPKIPSFYDKYLWSLNVFHTVTEIDLFDGARFLSNSISKNKEQNLGRPFKCGSLTTYSDNISLLRRKMYSRQSMASVTGINGKNRSSLSSASGSEKLKKTVAKRSSSFTGWNA